MRLLSRNVLREILPPFLIGLGAYTFLLILRSLLQISEMVVRRGLAFSTVLELLVLTLPQVLVLTIPMAFLFGILIGIGRLSGDSEIIAMRSGGVGRGALLRPVLAAALCLAAVVSLLSFWGYPAANDRFQRLQSKLFASMALDMIRPRVFVTPNADFDFVLLANADAPGTEGWKGVFIDDRSDPAEEKVVTADSGRLRSDARGLWLDLQNATSRFTDPVHPELYRGNRNSEQSLLLRQTPAIATTAGVKVVKGLREQTLPELLTTQRSLRKERPARYREAWVEIHKKFVIPFACIVFAFVGLPLGITNRRGGKGSGFAISIGIILGYYLLLNNGETRAENGKISPALAMWLPNILLAALGLFLFLRREEERRSWRDVVKTRWNKITARRSLPATISRRSYFSGLSLFPAALDRYILKPFLAALLAIYVSVIVLYIVVDYSDHADDIVRHHISRADVIAYYHAMLLPIIVQILPFCILLAALITLGALSRHNEDTAFRACGVALPRLGVGILVVALLASGGAYLAGEYYLPQANRRAIELLNRIKGRTPAVSTPTTSGFWILGSGNDIWNYDSFDPEKNILWHPNFYELDSQFRLVTRTRAEDARWTGTGWVFEKGWSRGFTGPGEPAFVSFAQYTVASPTPPKLFRQEREEPDTMRYRALARYTERLKKTGYPVAAFATALAEKPARAAQAVVLALLAISFAFSIGKRGTLTGIGVGLICGMIYLVLAAFFSKLGEVGSLPPLLAAWAPNFIFVLFASYRLTRLRT